MTDPSLISWIIAPVLGLLIGGLCCWSGVTPANAIMTAKSGDFRLLNTLALALSLNLAATHALAAMGMVQLDSSLHSEAVLNWTGLVFGSIIFGVGIALARTDIITAALQAGRGDMPAMAMCLIIAILTLAGTDGALQPFITLIQERAVLDLRSMDIPSLSLSNLIIRSEMLDSDLTLWGLAGLGLALFLYILAFRDLWTQPILLLTGLVLGLALPALWLSAQSPSTLPYLLLEPARLIVSFMGIPGIEATPLTLLIVGVAIGGGVTFAIPARHPLPEAPQTWRVLLGAIFMALGGIMASGDLLAHAAVGIAGLALPSIGCALMMIISAVSTAKMLDDTEEA